MGVEQDKYYQLIREAQPIATDKLKAINRFLGINTLKDIGVIQEMPVKPQPPNTFQNTRNFEMIIPGVDDLGDLIGQLQVLAAEINKRVEEKRDWWLSKSQDWRQGDVGSGWDNYLDDLKSLCDTIENLAIPDNT